MTDTQPRAATDDLTGTTWRDVRGMGDRAHVRHALRGDDSEWRVTFDGDHGLYVYPGSIIRSWTRVPEAGPAEDEQHGRPADASTVDLSPEPRRLQADPSYVPISRKLIEDLRAQPFGGGTNQECAAVDAILAAADAE